MRSDLPASPALPRIPDEGCQEEAGNDPGLKTKMEHYLLVWESGLWKTPSKKNYLWKWKLRTSYRDLLFSLSLPGLLQGGRVTIGTSGWRSVPHNRWDANSKIKCNMLEMHTHVIKVGVHCMYLSNPLDAQHVICASPLKFCYYTLETSMTYIQGWPVSMNKFSGTSELSLRRQRNVYSPRPIPRAPAPSKHAVLKPDPDGELSMSIPRKQWLKPTVILSNSLLKRASHREGNFNTTGLSWSRFYIIKSRIKREPKIFSKHSQQHYPHLLPGLNCSWDMVECLTPGVIVCGLHSHFYNGSEFSPTFIRR